MVFADVAFKARRMTFPVPPTVPEMVAVMFELAPLAPMVLLAAPKVRPLDGDGRGQRDGARRAAEDGGVGVGVVPSDMGRSSGVPVEEGGVPVPGGSAAEAVAIGQDVTGATVPVECVGVEKWRGEQGAAREEEGPKRGNRVHGSGWVQVRVRGRIETRR
jgi:hypothetical protein